jgi:phosphoglucosamine mutase
MGRLFGTDGVRGLANEGLTAQLALDLATAATFVLAEQSSRQRLSAIVGRDTRISGEFLEAAVVAGLASSGVDVTVVNYIPTPGLAFLVDELDADFGVMLSASHNPMPDNGIKFFARGGVKLADEIEDRIEENLGVEHTRPTGSEVGRVSRKPKLAKLYVNHLVASLGEKKPLKGLHVVLDPANGAASKTAPKAFKKAGATLTAIHHHPDGVNINDDCGSTHLESLQAAVLDTGADLGIGLDGDADRCLAVDHLGNVVDGDQILSILALAMKETGRLHDNTLVATVMSNLGLHKAMEAHGVKIDTTKVGDRYVVESMNEGGFTLGGEQSGHVILSEFATTGDGTLTALHLAAQVLRSKKTLGELASVMTRFPQVLINVPNVDKAAADTDEVVVEAVAQAEQSLAGNGRVLLRPSGTEPLVRVMVEAETEDHAQELAQSLAGVVKDRLSL